MRLRRTLLRTPPAPWATSPDAAAALPGNEASIALYVDGVYQGAKILSQIDLSDVECVEVLKKPQGTLYGRNATGAAINIIIEQPTDQFEGGGNSSYGRLDETVEEGHISGPLALGLNASLSLVARRGGDY
ncbi:TonB-dependent receptor plug domain-containing protein [Sphingomonas sp.]|uniref:TonB-dependent receptor plug domain-containing protein n=1 Tax=Sphingomonas sp. TaxID=28214 RepID=UPI003B00DB58